MTTRFWLKYANSHVPTVTILTPIPLRCFAATRPRASRASRTGRHMCSSVRSQGFHMLCITSVTSVTRVHPISEGKCGTRISYIMIAHGSLNMFYSNNERNERGYAFPSSRGVCPQVSQKSASNRSKYGYLCSTSKW